MRFRPGSAPIAAVAFLIASTSLFTAPVSARPQYAAREGRYCVSCHLDPAGGGMRHGNGFNYARGRHAWEVEPKFEEWKVDPEITKGVRVGGDVRYIGMAFQPKAHSGGADTGSEPWTFSSFAMQGSLYLALNPMEHVFLYYDHDLGASAQKQRDWWGMVRNLTPLNIYVKFGQIRPAYGIRLDDHTPFVRGLLQNVPGQEGIMDIDPRFTYPGVEVGMVKDPVFVHAGYNDEGSVFSPSFTKIREKMIGGRAGIHVGHLIAGGSFRANGHGDGDPDTRDHRRGLFALFGGPKFALVGEGDTGSHTFPGSDPGTRQNLDVRAGYLSGEYYVSRGVTTRVELNYMDLKDREADQFTDILRRYGAAVDWNPIPFLKFTAEGRHVSHTGTNTTGEPFDENWGLGYAVFSF